MGRALRSARTARFQQPINVLPCCCCFQDFRGVSATATLKTIHKAVLECLCSASCACSIFSWKSILARHARPVTNAVCVKIKESARLKDHLAHKPSACQSPHQLATQVLQTLPSDRTDRKQAHRALNSSSIDLAQGLLITSHCGKLMRFPDHEKRRTFFQVSKRTDDSTSFF